MSIEFFKFTNNAHLKDAKNILVVGVVHGDEPFGEFFIKEYIKLENRVLKNNLYYIPRLNQSRERKNPSGVDINRNFPSKNWVLGENDEYFGGFMPNSEEETKFLVDLEKKISLDAIIAIHAPYEIINFDGIENKNTILLAKKASEILGYPMQEDIGYLTPGSMGTYFGIERNIPTITIETEENPDKNLMFKKFKEFFSYLEKDF